MANENEKNIPEEENKTPASDTIEALTKALKEQKENSVSKEEFERVQKEKEELTKAIIDGSGLLNQSNKETHEVPLKDLAKSVLEDGIGNLEYAKRALAYREEFMKKFGKDPFAPNHAEMTEHDSARAEAVAEIMADCIEAAQGSESVYNALFNDRVKEDSPQMLAHLKRKGLIK